MIPIIPPALPLISPEAIQTQLQDTTVGHQQPWRFHDEYVLGTRLSVLVNVHSAMLAKKAANAARSEIDRLNRVFNTRLPDSEISSLNEARSIDASSEFFAVVSLSEQWRRITGGAFDGRMGELLRLWNGAAPTDKEIEYSLESLNTSKVELSPKQRRIDLVGASLSLDAIAKGYIVDSAINAARRAAPTLKGIAIDIGGDIRCWGDAPHCEGWPVGIPDARNAADNAPLVDAVLIKNASIATSGRGPRDCVADGYRSATISPLTGRPVSEVLSASVVASHAADADAIATACMVLAPNESIDLIETLGVAARITDVRGGVHYSSKWPTLQLAAATQVKPQTKSPVEKSGQKNVPAPDQPGLPPERRWPADWEIGITYIAPERRESERSVDFRTPYMVLWFTDEKNKAVNTPVIVGRDPDWQHDNFIWWGSHGARAEPLIELRAQATALSGRYRIFWGGRDDNWNPLPIGKYTLHLETSQERGKHEYRSIALEIGREQFKKSLPNLPGSGGLEITYGHYNDRFKYE